ncbi:MAG TPA: radical SAM protein [Candidatus Moranbacteria bacterium]|nr:radical SAM protein [Candidatus Moranbacteria bacterium]
MLFCYFSMKVYDYTPLDIGYILALIKEKNRGEYDCEIVELPMSLDAEDGHFKQEINLILSYHPTAVFFFLDSIVWSKIFSLGRAKKIARELKDSNPDIFVGFQSYKFHPKNIKETLALGGVDCIIGNDPENSFLYLDEILKNNLVSGVFTKKEMNETLPGNKKINNTDLSLDYIPSPYLNHILDEFLEKKQKQTAGSFSAFVYSSRGCRFGCYYCFRSVKFEKVRFFSVKRFYDEIEYLNCNFGISSFMVLDDAFLFSKNRLQEFCVEFEKRKIERSGLGKINFFVMARPESLVDEETIRIMAQMNVTRVQVGLQSINPSLQKYMNRELPVEEFEHISNLLKKHKVKLSLDIIVGLPGDDVDYLKKTLDYAISLDPLTIQIKQFYLNPDTLFFTKKGDYHIKIENEERDFEAPYVISASGEINDEYHRKAYDYIMENIKKNPQIRWRFLSKIGNYFSFGKK